MADSGEQIGSVSVLITGDAGPLKATYVEVQSFSAKAGKQIADAFVSGSAESTAAINRLALALETAGQSGTRVFKNISNASHGAVTDIQAVSGTLRTLDGNQGIRAAERFLTMIPGLAPALQAAFPLIGAIAFAEVVGRAVEHFEKLGKGANDAANAVQRAFREINLGAQESNDSLQVANDRLENEIAKIEKKPENGIKLALDEAILSADQLGKSLDADLSKLTKVLTEQKTGIIGQIFGKAATSDIEDQVQEFQDKVAKVTASSSIPKQESFGGVSLLSPELLARQKEAAQIQTNTRLQALYTDEILRFSHELQTAQNIQKSHITTGIPRLAPTGQEADETRRIALLQQTIGNLQAQWQSIGLKAVNANLQGEKGKAQTNADSQRQAEEAANRALEQLHRQIEAFEAQLRAYAQAKRAQDELNVAAEKLYQTTHRLAVESAKVAQNLRLGGVELANKSSEALSGQRPPTRGEQERQEAVNQPALQRLQGGNAVQQQLALAIQLKQVGIETNSEIQSRIGNLQQELAAAEKTNAPIAERLKLEKEILEARIAAATANGQTDQADKLAAANVALQQTLTQWKALDLGDAAQTIEGTLVKIPATLADAISKGIFDHQKGQNAGTDIAKAFAGLGKQLFGELLTDGFEKLIATLLGQGIFASAQTTATAANTAALIANTAAVTASGGASAAGGAVSAAGGVASSAASLGTAAATGGASMLAPIIGGVISGVISAVATFVGDAGIIKAVNATTAAVLSLHQTVATGSTADGSSQPSLAAPSQSIGGQIAASLFTALTGAGALDVNVVSISPIAIGAGFLHLFGFASGTNSAPGGWSLIGEKGPELMNVPRGAQIVPNHAIKSYADGTPGYARSYGGASHSTSIGELHVHAHGVNDPGSFARQAVALIPHELKRQSSSFSPYSH